ncbi:hypothetical protein BH24ACI2_BH24ACI2_14850 [soil metagenome]
MRYKITFLISILAIFLYGCTGPESPTNTNSINKTANTNITNTNNPLETSKTPEVSTTNIAPTITPVVKAYCEAFVKKDEAGFRKNFSQETLRQYESDMKAEGKNSLIEFFADTESPNNKLCEARNEKIDGNSAVAEVRTDNAPNGVKYKFVKENGEWKWTNESPDFQSVKQSVTNSNSSK